MFECIWCLLVTVCSLFLVSDLERLRESTVEAWAPRQVDRVVGDVEDPEVFRRVGAGGDVEDDYRPSEAHLVLSYAVVRPVIARVYRRHAQH